MMGYWGYGYGNPGYSMFGGIFMLIFWVVVVTIFVLVIRKSRMHDHSICDGLCMGHHLGGRALDILKERYAKGEIDKKEFEEKKKDLMM